ncbi:MAG: iron ABC transporter permease [Candidatus Thorarchaeota archaeon]|nr:iron ABC transporter permease [Candidatus Thorarchaeota archaeon]
MRPTHTAQWVLVIPLTVLVVFILYPVAYVTFAGLVPQWPLSLTDTLGSVVTHRTLQFTFAQALVSTALTLAIGLPGAFILARLDFRAKSLVRATIIVPFVLPPIAVVIGFLRMFGAYGIVDSALGAILGTTSSVINLASGPLGIVLAHAFYNIPIVLLVISSSLQRLPPELEDVAEALGASPLQRLRRIVLPHISHSLMASSLLVFLFCFLSFPIVLALGEGNFMTVEVQIWNAFRTFDYPEASALVLMQAFVTTSIAVAYSYATRNEQQAMTVGSIRTVHLSDLTLPQRTLVVLYSAAIVVLVAGPVVSTFHSAVYDSVRRTYTLEGLQNLLVFGTGGGLLPLINSLFYASISTLFAVLLAFPLAYVRRGRTSRSGTLASALVMLPLGVSSITVAYGLMQAIAVPLGLGQNPWLLIVFAQTIVGLPFTTRSIEIALLAMEPDIMDQADLLGASRLQKLFFVELPILAPGIAVGAAFAFAMAIGEMSATLFIALPQNITLSVAVYQYLGVRKFVHAGAAALVLVMCCITAFVLIERVAGVEKVSRF